MIGLHGGAIGIIYGIFIFMLHGNRLLEYTMPDPPVPSHSAHFAYATPPFTCCPMCNPMRSVPKCVSLGFVSTASGFFITKNIALIIPAMLLQPPITMPPLAHFICTPRHGRDILSGQWWQKNCWPPKLEYDHWFFWHHGGLLLLGLSHKELEREQDDPTFAFYSLSDNLSPLLTPECQLEPKDFESKNLCNLVVYDLALLNHNLQFEETNDFVMHIDSMSLKDCHARLQACGDLFRSSWDIPKDAFPWHDTNWESSKNWRRSVSWYACFHSLFTTWPREFDLDGINWDKDLSCMDQWQFTEYACSLVIFYRCTVMHVLGIAIAPLLHYPSLDVVDPAFLSM
ncbi:hypothetical protein J3R82DRAFT_7739 [Butyriboletus roseoflavus]|nr:hypothetical protein J3R82DRAFT_7739 [Butyriboletus roseoflavus]